MPITEVHLDIDIAKVKDKVLFTQKQKAVEDYINEHDLGEVVSSHLGEIYIHTEDPEKLRSSLELKLNEYSLEKLVTISVAEVFD